MRPGWPLDTKPLIVFWESTKACLLSCIHCRAEAISRPLPGELSTEDAYKLVNDIAEFGAPYPLLVVSGGDPLMRRDLWDIVSYASGLGIRVSLAPSVTPLLDGGAIKNLGARCFSSIYKPRQPIPGGARQYKGL